jgi:hypothetical protein
MASETQATNVSPAQLEGRIQVQVTADVNITAAIARRLVNTELMMKVGQGVMTGEPRIYIHGTDIYWEVPLFVVPPDDDDNTYPLGKSAFVDAIAGRYVLTEGEIQEIRAISRPILGKLYPETKAWVEKLKQMKTRTS